MTHKTVTHDLTDGWQQTVTIFDADVLVNPPRWKFWSKPYIEVQTFVTSLVHKKDKDGILLREPRFSAHGVLSGE